jgi:hypothetical protein
MEPNRLEDSTLKIFEESYIASDKELAKTDSAPLSPQLKQACRAPDGTYLPILIRFAIRAGGEGVQNIADLYSVTFAQLLRSQAKDTLNTDLLDQACKLCVDTYWKSGYRTLPYALVEYDRRVLLTKLLNAGILIPADEIRNRISGEPKQLRFFHDSMQSFLTARGLYVSCQDNDDWSVLQRAAGEPKFIMAQSDLFLGEGSELFQMCIYIFTPLDKLLNTLRAHLYTWSEKHDGDLRKNEVISSVPEELENELKTLVGPSDGAGAALKRAIPLCFTPDVEHSLRNAAVLYSKIARLLWPFITSVTESKDVAA